MTRVVIGMAQFKRSAIAVHVLRGTRSNETHHWEHQSGRHALMGAPARLPTGLALAGAGGQGTPGVVPDRWW
jgi:hypothetical protein